jgi:ABC-2 type transport system ATP-binding protein
VTPAIELRGVVKDYDTTRALAGIDLAVEPGRVFGFLGPNGAGKTTTIRILLDLIRPTHGTAAVLGFDAQRQSVEVRRRCGYLPGEMRL